jgi:hypothetical protein
VFAERWISQQHQQMQSQRLEQPVMRLWWTFKEVVERLFYRRLEDNPQMEVQERLATLLEPVRQ